MNTSTAQGGRDDAPARTVLERFAVFTLFPTVLYTVAFALLTWPLATTFSSHFWADESDGMQGVRNLWWLPYAVLDLGANPWWTDHLHHPHGSWLLGHNLMEFDGMLALLARRRVSSRSARETLLGPRGGTPAGTCPSIPTPTSPQNPAYTPYPRNGLRFLQRLLVFAPEAHSDRPRSLFGLPDYRPRLNPPSSPIHEGSRLVTIVRAVSDSDVPRRPSPIIAPRQV